MSSTSLTCLTSEDNIYLAKVIGTPLSKCLKELVTVEPADPFKWIADWLFKYQDNLKYFFDQREFYKEVNAMRVIMKKEQNNRRRTTALLQNEKKRMTNMNAKYKVFSPFSSADTDVLVKSLTPNRPQNRRPNRPPNKKMVEVKLSTLEPFTSTDFLNLTGQTAGPQGSQLSLKEEDPDAKNNEMRGLRYRRDSKGAIAVFGPDGMEYVLGKGGSLVPKEDGKRKPNRMSEKELVDVQMMFDQNSTSKAARKLSTGAGIATWGVNQRLGLVCRHPVLGDMEPRPPLMYPETPEWWERKGYLPETTYDHEVYSRENDDVIRNWDKMEHMTYKEFVEEGPWLFQGLLLNTHQSYADMVQMPVNFKKRIRKSKEGDYFPKNRSYLDNTSPKEDAMASAKNDLLDNQTRRAKGKRAK